MDTTPTRYSDISPIALKAKEQYNLSDTQTLLYNHICRGDFKLRNADGQKFYDKNNNGFGWTGDRDWVKRKLKPLIDKGLVEMQSLRDCGSGRYTSWYFYNPDYKLSDLVDAGCFVKSHKIMLIKHYLNLPDGFDKNSAYEDIEFIHNKKGYTFKYKGEKNIYAWDNNGYGIKQDLTWLTGKKTYDRPMYYETFNELVHDIWSFLAHDGHKHLGDIPGCTEKRQFSI